MQKESNQNGIFQIAVNLTIASLISGTVLASAYFITEPFSIAQRIKLKNQTMKELVQSATDFRPVTGKEGWYTAGQNGTNIAVIIPCEGRGFGGSIKILLAADTNKAVIDFKILSHNETPGLGDRAAQTNFRDQFKGKKMENLEVVKIHDENKIDAITGATITSRAVTGAVREGLENLEQYIKKE